MRELNFKEVMLLTERFHYILEAVYQLLKDVHLKTPIPAQETGKWKHHVYEYGLLKHSVQTARNMLSALNNAANTFQMNLDIDETHPFMILLMILGLAHDFGKLYGDDTASHPKTSLEKLEKLIDRQKITAKLVEQFKINETQANLLLDEFLSSELWELIRLAIRYHHLHYENPNAFYNRDESVIPEKYFKWMLLLTTADFASTASDWIVNLDIYTELSELQ